MFCYILNNNVYYPYFFVISITQEGMLTLLEF